MADHLGSFNASSTIYFYFTTHAASGAAVAPSSAFEAADLVIYKNGSATQRTSASGITMTSPFDSVTGLHAVAIDLSDNTDASFYAAGSEYVVVLSPDETVDSLAVVKVLAYFSIERVVKVNVTQFGGSAGTFASGRPDVNMTYIAGSAVSTSSAQLGVNVVNFGGSAGTFASGRPEVNTSHAAGTAWGSGAITAAAIASDAITAAKIADGAIDANTFAAGAITASAIAADAITDAKVASDVTIASVTGAVGSVTGAVGSVTGNVGGNVTGSVGSVVGAVGSVTSRVTANTDQLAGQTVTAAAGVTFPTSVASPTNITAGTITTVTNLTNAATAGDFTSTMKTSIGTAVAASAVASVTGAVGSVTGNVGGNVTGSVGSLATQAKADVNTEVVDALATDTYAEPGQGTPSATLSLSAKIGYLFKAWRNKSTQTSTAYNLFNDDAATVDQKATTSDDATTFTRGEISTGP